MPSPYPTAVTAADLPKYAHITDATVAKDLADTEDEIAKLRRLREADLIVAQSHPAAGHRRMAQFRAEARPQQIAEREAFVTFLTTLQAARAAQPKETDA